MCHDCPTRRSRTRAVLGELVADLAIPFVRYDLLAGLLLLAYRRPR